MAKKGLGRGLNALFGDVTPQIKAKPMDSMQEIAIDDIYPNPLQPRREFDENALDELASSIKVLGLIQPITVKPDGDKYMIISGERRWRASKMAGLETVPAFIKDVDNEDLHAMALVENIQREDLNAIEVALGLQRLVDECGLTQEALSEKVGKKRSTIANYMRLLHLPNEIQAAVKNGYISMGHAKAIASLSEKKQQLKLLKKCLKDNLSVRQAEDMSQVIADKVRGKATAVVEEDYPESYISLVEHLERFFNQQISIRRTKNGGGKIIINFSNDNDIESFIEHFKQTK